MFLSSNPNDLPQLQSDDPTSKEEKSFKIPIRFTLDKIIAYLYNDMALNKYFFKQRDHPHEQLELMLKTNVLAPEDGQP